MEREKSYLVWLVCASTIRTLDLYLEGEPGLVLRGCITYGEHAVQENFVVGPAVDAAAENMEVGQGAFVWLHPTAATKYRRAVRAVRNTIELLSITRADDELLQGSKQSLNKPLMVDSYDMPIKGGGHLRCPVINPLAFHETEEDRRAVFNAYEKALSGNDLDVLLKHQHTMDFLREAENARRRYKDEYAEFINSLTQQPTKKQP